MFEHEYLLKQPLFFLFIAFSLFLSLGYYWGRRRNKNIFLSAFNALVEVVKPDEQKFTNIGGTIGYHANLFVRKKGPVSQVDATITKVVDLGFLRRLKPAPASAQDRGNYEVRRILKAFVDAQWLAEFDARLEVYRTALSGGAGKDANDA